MAASCEFHPEALSEYEEAALYYLYDASVQVADGFVMTVERAITVLAADPTLWRVVEAPDIRRYVLGRFPFVIYYR